MIDEAYAEKVAVAIRVCQCVPGCECCPLNDDNREIDFEGCQIDAMAAEVIDRLCAENKSLKATLSDTELKHWNECWKISEYQRELSNQPRQDEPSGHFSTPCWPGMSAARE